MKVYSALSVLMFCFAADVPCGADDGFILDHKTLYFDTPVEGCYRFELTGAIKNNEGAGTLLMDKNTCELNPFGDRAKCTAVQFEPFGVRFTLIEGAEGNDPANKGRKLFSIWRAEDDKVLPNITLMIQPDGAPRLVSLDRAGKRRVFVLVPRNEIDGPISGAELCTGKYTAQQTSGTVFIFGSGVHGTAGYHTFFDETPTDENPPEFRLMHVKPSGPSAQMITPFVVHMQFQAKGKLEHVVVHDADGPHKVTVEQVPDVK